MGLVQIPCIYSVNRFTRFKREGKRVQVVSDKFLFRTIRSIQFLNEVTTMTSIAEDLVGTPNCITQLRMFFNHFGWLS